tara:strand:+ start:1103 stop:1864 length:762 start_codon:yes stop_codon:yes gene_type:complete
MTIASIALTVLKDALRRKENLLIVIAAAALIVFTLALDFFGLGGVVRIYRDGGLRIISFATAICVVVLAARQLPATLKSGTPARVTLLAGKALGVLLFAACVLVVLTAVFTLAGLRRDGLVPWPMYLQFLYLQLLMMLTLTAVSFLLSAILNLDAAIVVGALYYAVGLGAVGVLLVMYPYLGGAVRGMLFVANYLLPQLIVFDLHDRTVHAENWPMVGAIPLLLITLYGLVYSAAYTGLAAWVARRKQGRAMV